VISAKAAFGKQQMATIEEVIIAARATASSPFRNTAMIMPISICHDGGDTLVHCLGPLSIDGWPVSPANPMRSAGNMQNIDFWLRTNSFCGGATPEQENVLKTAPLWFLKRQVVLQTYQSSELL
jgi:hypothetical protein